MSQALSALRLGYLLHRLRWVQDRIWSGPLLSAPDIEPILHELDEALLGLSRRMNAYERSMVLALKERLIACHYEASGHCCDFLMLEAINRAQNTARPSQRWREQVDHHPATEAFKKLQKQNWSDLRIIVTNVVADEPRLLAWFEMGDQLGEVIHGLHDGRIACPLPRTMWTYLYSGMDKLPPCLRKRLEPLYPASYKSPSHLACQLQDTYSALCHFAERRLGRDWLGTPKWDGMVIRYLDGSATIRGQYNSVIVHILGEFERLNWPLSISIPHAVTEAISDVERGVSDAIHHFNATKGVIRLSRNGDRVGWGPPAR
jgi:hypothetical protein